jgi:hypothetical protein
MFHPGRDNVPLGGVRLQSAATAGLLLSVAQEVKITSREGAPINSATCSRAVSTTGLSFDPNLYAPDGLPAEVHSQKSKVQSKN